jgi:hypothetical protein
MVINDLAVNEAVTNPSQTRNRAIAKTGFAPDA